MKEQIDILVKIQKIDTETGHITAKLKDVYKKCEALDLELKAFEQNIEDENARISDLKKKYRDHESDTEVNASRLKKNQEKLRAVKTNKEYQSMLKEIEDLKAKNSRIEDEMLECLDLTERAEEAVAAKKLELLKRAEDVKIEKENILQDSEEGEKRLAELEAERGNHSSTVDKELLDIFMKIKQRQAGNIAIVSVKDAVCKGCNMNIPPQMYNELYRGNDLKFCPNCQRIIYLERETAPQTE